VRGGLSHREKEIDSKHRNGDTDHSTCPVHQWVAPQLYDLGEDYLISGMKKELEEPNPSNLSGVKKEKRGDREVSEREKKVAS